MRSTLKLIGIIVIYNICALLIPAILAELLNNSWIVLADLIVAPWGLLLVDKFIDKVL